MTEPPIIAFRIATCLTFLLIVIRAEETCPRACGSIISKCQIIEACRCETRFNSTCKKKCSLCLSDEYSDCCQCVGVCPTSINPSLEFHAQPMPPTNISPDLFEIVSVDPDMEGFMVYIEPMYRTHTLSTPASPANLSPNIAPPVASSFSMPVEVPNCTMLFKSTCVDYYKCFLACQAIGASGLKWFHNGCCECVSKTCLNYGVSDPRCSNCPQEAAQRLDSPTEIIL